MSECKCRVCIQCDEFKRHVDKIRSKKERDYFWSVYEQFAMTEDHVGVLNAVIAGTWPSADDHMRGVWVRAAPLSTPADGEAR